MSVAEDEAPTIYAQTHTPTSLYKTLKLDGRLGYRLGKRAFDILAASCGVALVSPVMLGIAVAVRITSPGPIIFSQSRVGRSKKIFRIYKFRTMRIDAPSDMASAELNTNSWLTPVGKSVRRLSLDELPQFLNVLKGDMSIVGPRPALWNQFDLVAERDKYGANEVTPGITGWAQVNGRDELTIELKSCLDGEYVSRRSLAFDAKCVLLTIAKVLAADGVVEDATRGHEAEARRL